MRLSDSVSLSAKRHIDRVCLEFEAAWQRAPRPPLEPYLEAAVEPELSSLLMELLLLDLDYRIRCGETPDRQQYGERFPAHGRIVEAVFRQSGLTCASGPDRPRFGDYELLQEIARGGMGVVYKARQVSLDRIVALKMIRTGQLASPENVDRFKQEARVVAALRHPNIVAIHEVGEHGHQHYFSMDYIEGRSLAEMIRDGPLAARRAARCMKTVAEAVHYAHQQGTLHRDLKPSNVMVDAAGEPHIADFGLARRIESLYDMTASGQLLGTPSYMAPEQAAGNPAAVGPASDVWGLGAMLYELLTGRPPFRGETAVVTLRHAIEEEPASPRLLNPAVPRDLDVICTRCLQKEPQSRYGSARELADDLGRFLRNEPIRARPVGRLVRLGRWCRRNPVAASLAGLALLLVLALSVGASIASLLLAHQRDAALRAEDHAVEHLWESYLAQAEARRWSGHPGRRADALDAIARAAAIKPTLELRNHAVACMALVDLRLAQQWDLGPISGPYPPQQALAFSPSLDQYVTSDARGNLTLRRVPDASPLQHLPGPGHPAWVTRFSPRGRYLAVKYHPPDNIPSNRLWVWDLKRGQVAWKSTHDIAAGAVDFAPDEGVVALADCDGAIYLYDTVTGTQLERWAGSPDLLVKTVRFQPRGASLAVIALRNIHLRQVPGGQILHDLRPGVICMAAWHPQRDLLAAACFDGTIRIFQTDSGQERAVIQGGPAWPTLLTYANDGDLLASYWSDMTLRLSHSLGGTTLLSVPHAMATNELTFAPGNQLLGYAITSGGISLYQVIAAPECRVLLGEPSSALGFYSPVSFSPDGSLLAAAYADGVHLWDLRLGEQAACLPAQDAKASEFLPDGSALLVSGPSGLWRWPVVTEADGERGTLRIGPPRRIALPGGAAPGRITISRDGRLLGVIHDRSVIVLDAATGGERGRFGDLRGLEYTAISPDARWLACATWRGSELTIYDLPTGKPVFVPPDSCDAAAEFSPDGRWLATGTEREYRLWSVPAWRLIARFPANGMWNLPGRIAFSPDGRTLAVVCSWAAIRLIDLPSGRELATLEAPDVQQRIDAIRFSPDGGLLAAGNRGCRVHLWDLRQIRQRLAALRLDWDSPPLPSALPLSPSRTVRAVTATAE